MNPFTATLNMRALAKERAAAPNLGQIIEYIPDRLYLASYINPPNEDTLFPYPEPPPLRTPTKRSQRAVDAPTPALNLKPRKQPYYFTIDDELFYNAFHHDFGPLHIGHLYRFALKFHDILGAKENRDRPVVFWSMADPKSRANASCLLACYMVLIQSWPPHLALAPIAQVDPPLMPFRDAGYSQADYGLTIQDMVYGVWKAKEEGCCLLDNFDLDEYEKYERVESGDFNWISPHFLAFASPMHLPVERITPDSDLFATLPGTIEAIDEHKKLPAPFKEVLKHFRERNIGLVVRLNSALYSPSWFEALGIQHLDMIFEDGTCPPLTTVRKFIRLAHETINIRKKGIAVHCKAGLGRTGCLIGAYLIYRHGFTANEVIAYMRFMRPGMVVGPQQHWLHLNQGVFREWWIEERVERKMRKAAALAAAAAAANGGGHQLPSTPIRAMQRANLGRSGSKTYTPPQNRSASNRTPLSEMDQDHARDNTIGVQEDFLPAPTPGQPRKTNRAAGMDRHHPYSRSTSVTHSTIVQEDQAPAVPAPAQRTDSEEEWLLRMRAQRKPSAAAVGGQASPDRRERQASTVTTTTTTTVYQVIDNDASNDIENVGSAAVSRMKSVDQRASSASGVLAKVRKTRATTSGTGSVREAGVRKTSGRVGSVGAAAGSAAARKISGL
ncbi:protein-tyrosine phosphatase-like protein [Coniochaeta sp. 2T2.1]|nr:protein-tyrosine phosphatase-like protein [Coniochaeta sp. 2T2.1]